MFLDRVRRYCMGIKRKIYLSKKCNLRHTMRLGNSYGGFDVFPEVLQGKKIIVYSFGIGGDLSFSEDVLKSFDAEIYAFDPTPKSIRFVQDSEIYKTDSFTFSPYGLSDKSEETKFFLPNNDEWVSGSSVIKKDKKEEGIRVEMRDLQSIMKDNGHNRIDLLKMDIEGSEFKTVEAWAKHADMSGFPDISQICLEVHDRYFEEGFALLEKLLDNLDRLGYVLIHVSDSYEELTFLKNA